MNLDETARLKISDKGGTAIRPTLRALIISMIRNSHMPIDFPIEVTVTDRDGTEQRFTITKPDAE